MSSCHMGYVILEPITPIFILIIALNCYSYRRSACYFDPCFDCCSGYEFIILAIILIL
jgi:hypothetical protein